jgi:hypothetical protein
VSLRGDEKTPMCGGFVQIPFGSDCPWPKLAGDMAKIDARYNVSPTQWIAQAARHRDRDIRGERVSAPGLTSVSPPSVASLTARRTTIFASCNVARYRCRPRRRVGRFLRAT